MMTPHRYTLQPYKTPASRYACPLCGQRKKFTRYIDTQTNTHLASHVGKCDREESCGYHFTPKQYFAANPQLSPPTKKAEVLHTAKPKPVARYNTLPVALMQLSFTQYANNNFVRFLRMLFNHETVKRLIDDYYIGTSKHWPGATVFWQVDANYKVRTGKIMLYDAETGHRVKYPYSHITWVHTLIQNSKVKSQNTSGTGSYQDEQPKTGFNLKQCLFGEHLLAGDRGKTVALVESEKTAIIASAFMPEYLWLAAGSLEGINYSKCKVLKGRQVILFPDIDGFFKWQDKMLELCRKMPETRFRLSDMLQRNIPREARIKGTDIADYLISDLLMQWEYERELGLRE